MFATRSSAFSCMFKDALQVFFNKMKKLWKNYNFFLNCICKLCKKFGGDLEPELEIILIKTCFLKIIKIKWENFYLNYEI